MAICTCFGSAMCQSASTCLCLKGITDCCVLPVRIFLAADDERNLDAFVGHGRQPGLEFGAIRRTRGVGLRIGLVNGEQALDEQRSAQRCQTWEVLRMANSLRHFLTRVSGAFTL